MTGPELGFLLLGSQLGDPQRKPLSTAAMRQLAGRVKSVAKPDSDRTLQKQDMIAIGYGDQMAQHIVDLLRDEQLLSYYLRKAKQADCEPLTRISTAYPQILRKRLGDDAPAVLWAKGDISILEKPMISLVGSRDIAAQNKGFAAEVGRQAALQGYVLVSGNARGADQIAQNACLENGGYVISVVADELEFHSNKERVLYLSEEDFDAPFTSQRALSRNRVIHALADKTFVAQCDLGMGGTWAGSMKNLRNGWSPLFCFDDGSEAVTQLEQFGAQCIDMAQLGNIHSLTSQFQSFFDQ